MMSIFCQDEAGLAERYLDGTIDALDLLLCSDASSNTKLPQHEPQQRSQSLDDTSSVRADHESGQPAKVVGVCDSSYDGHLVESQHAAGAHATFSAEGYGARSDPRASADHAQHTRASADHAQHVGTPPEEAQPVGQPCASCSVGVPGGMPDSRAAEEHLKHAESLPEEAQPNREPCASCSVGAPGGIPRHQAGELTYDEFVLQYMATNQPVMIQAGLRTMTFSYWMSPVKSMLALYANFLCHGALEQSCWLFCIEWLTCPL